MTSSITGRGPAKTHVVILGGGIGGVAAARHLDRQLRRRTDITATLVSRDNFFLLTPLLFEACSGVLELRHCAQPIRPCLRHVRFLEGTVRHVDVERRVVSVLLADGAMHDLPYDQLVVTLGANTNTKLIPGSEHACTFKTVADALLLRTHLIEQLERAYVETDPEKRRELMTVVVIGGGLVGVELLGELTAFLVDELRYYPGLDPDALQFHLFEAGDRLIPESKPSLAEYAAEVLQRRRAKLHTGTPVAAIGPDEVRWKDGAIRAATIVLAPGIVPNAVAAAMAVEHDRRGRVVTDATLSSVSHPNVWAFGDCAATPAPGGGIYPALAQHAVRAARVAARNVVAAIDRRTPKPFLFEPLGTMAAFGHTRAAADVRGVTFKGFFAWWLRRTYYLFQMPRWDTRVRIAFDWTVSLLFQPDLTKIDLAKIDLANEREQERRNAAAGAFFPTVDAHQPSRNVTLGSTRDAPVAGR
jgi:NADH dehydrogenase